MRTIAKLFCTQIVRIITFHVNSVYFFYLFHRYVSQNPFHSLVVYHKDKEIL